LTARIARSGQTRPVHSHRILADHWLERRRIERVESKMAEEAEFIQSLKRV
jgi:SNF2 family DNA or RNA helicase